MHLIVDCFRMIMIWIFSNLRRLSMKLFHCWFLRRINQGVKKTHRTSSLIRQSNCWVINVPIRKQGMTSPMWSRHLMIRSSITECTRSSKSVRSTVTTIVFTLSRSCQKRHRKRNGADTLCTGHHTGTIKSLLSQIYQFSWITRRLWAAKTAKLSHCNLWPLTLGISIISYRIWRDLARHQ